MKMTNDLEKRLEEVVKPVFTDKKIVCKKCGHILASFFQDCGHIDCKCDCASEEAKIKSIVDSDMLSACVDRVLPFVQEYVAKSNEESKKESVADMFDFGFYTGYCDVRGEKIYSGDWLRFNELNNCIWEARVIFEDGYPTVSSIDIRQVKNPDGWEEKHNWIKSRWWSVKVGFGEYGSWNCARKPLIDIAGYFSDYEEMRKARKKFIKKYGVSERCVRELPVEIVKKYKSEK